MNSVLLPVPAFSELSDAAAVADRHDDDARAACVEACSVALRLC